MFPVFGTRPSGCPLAGRARRRGDRLPSRSDSKGARWLSHALAIVAAGGAIVGWIAVAGAVREYARLSAAGVPVAQQTVSFFPREVLFGEGLALLSVLALVSIAASAVCYAAVRTLITPASSSVLITPLPTPRSRVRDRMPITGWRLPREEKRVMTPLVLGIAGVGGIVASWVLFGFNWWEIATAFIVIAAAVPFWMDWLEGPPAAALVVFAAVFLGGGFAAFGSELASKSGDFDSVVVQRRGLEPVSGFYLTRSNGEVYVAALPTRQAAHRTKHDKFAVIAVPEGEVETVDIGPSYALHAGHVPQQTVKVSEVAEPKGKSIVSIEGGSITKTRRERREEAEREEREELEGQPPTSTTSTTNNGGAVTITNETTTIQQSAPPAAGATAPVVQLYAPAPLTPTGSSFCLTIGAANTAENVHVVFTAPTLGAEGRDFYQLRRSFGPRGRQTAPIPLGALVHSLSTTALLPVDVKISASHDGVEATTAYHLRLAGAPTRSRGPATRAGAVCHA